MRAFPPGAALRVLGWQVIRNLRGMSGGLPSFALRQLLWPALSLGLALLSYAPFAWGGAREIAAARPAFAEGLALGPWLLAGVLVLAIFLEYVSIGSVLAGERDYGVQELLALSPAPRSLWLWGSAAAGLPSGLLGTGLFALLAALALGALPPRPGLFALCFAAVLLASLPWGAFIVAAFAAGRNMRLVYALFETPAEFLAGARFPLRALPAGLLALALGYPLGRAILVLRHTLGPAPDARALGGELLALGLLGLGYGLAAFGLSRFAEARERRNGDADRA